MKIEILVILSFVLFILGYLIQEYDLNIGFKVIYGVYKYRNGLFWGLPFLIIGNYLYRKKDKLNIIPKKFIITAFILFIGIFIYEICKNTDNTRQIEFYLSLILIVPTSFIIILRFSKNKLENKTVNIGELTEPIYLIHPLVIFMTSSIFVSLSINDNIFKVPIIFLVSLIFSIGLIDLNKRIKIFL